MPARPFRIVHDADDGADSRRLACRTALSRGNRAAQQRKLERERSMCAVRRALRPMTGDDGRGHAAVGQQPPLPADREETQQARDRDLRVLDAHVAERGCTDIAEHILESKAGDFDPDTFVDHYEEAVVDMRKH